MPPSPSVGVTAGPRARVALTWSSPCLPLPQQQRHGAPLQHEVQERGASLRPAAGDAGRAPPARPRRPWGRERAHGGDEREPAGQHGRPFVTFPASLLHHRGGGELPHHGLRAPGPRRGPENPRGLLPTSYIAIAESRARAHSSSHPPPWLSDMSGHLFACSVLSGTPSLGDSQRDSRAKFFDSLSLSLLSLLHY